MEFDLPFNVVLGQLTLYCFMVVVHYGFLMFKMLTPNVIMLHIDYVATTTTIEKLHILVATHNNTDRELDVDPLEVCASVLQPRGPVLNSTMCQ
jgi:hypothetical protein